MGKNSFGGNKQKRQANKVGGVSSGFSPFDLSDPELRLCVVFKMNGNNTFQALSLKDKGELFCHIRAKFRRSGRNLIVAGALVLVGLREGMSSRTEGDLIYVYEKGEIDVLTRMPEHGVGGLMRMYGEKTGGGRGGGREDDGVVFSNDAGGETDETATATAIIGEGGRGQMADDTAINIDDI